MPTVFVFRFFSLAIHLRFGTFFFFDALAGAAFIRFVVPNGIDGVGDTVDRTMIETIIFFALQVRASARIDRFITYVTFSTFVTRCGFNGGTFLHCMIKKYV